jgi:hypothetical protein
MTELKPWLDDAPPDEIRRLLEVAREENAPSRVMQRTLAALGATSATAIAGAGSAATAGAKLGILGIALKWGGAGLLSGTLVAGAVAGIARVAANAPSKSRVHVTFTEPASSTTNPGFDLPRHGVLPAPPSADAPNPDAPNPDAPPSTLAPASAPASPTLETEASARARSSTETRPSAESPASALAPPAPASTEPATAREVAVVDAARSALRRGDGRAALDLLDDYERAFSPPHLEPEVLYLRMQAEKASFDLAAARRTAALIVSRFPRSPEVGRAEEILRAGDAAPKE